MQHYDAELRAWALYRYQGFIVIAGKIYGDKKDRFPDGRMIQTSPLLTPNAARNGNVVATLYSHYLLVGPKPGDAELQKAELPSASGSDHQGIKVSEHGEQP